ncbi:MAG: DUF3788 domain-containing protein [Nitrososphaerota archaeon]|nr:DUF3788 domain-containing protein [Nitrososphaerota archaeon]
MEKQILTDAGTYPDNSVIEKALGADWFGLFLEFIEKIENLNLTIEWRYYNDGKAWLGKIWHKKKNLGWLSIWNVGFKVTVFFTEKTIEGFNALGVDVKAQTSTGKLIPILMTINDDSALDNLITILKYKKELK